MTEHFGYFDAMLDSNGNYDREYNAQQWTEPFRALVTTGVMKGAHNQLEVTANGANMVSAVKSGVAFIEGRYYYNDALVELTHDTEVIGVRRIDRIVVRMDSRTEARHVKTFIKKGVPSTNPVAPTLSQTQDVYEISLAQVLVVGGQTFIATNAIADERGKDIICPWAGSQILPSFDDNALGDHIQNDIMHVKYGVDASTNNAKAVQIDGVTEYKDGMAIAFKVGTTWASGNASLDVNGLGAKWIRKSNDTSLPSNSLKANSIYTVRFNATNQSFILQGEGGEYGNATAPQVLAGFTIGTENGLVNGTMANRTGLTSTGIFETSAAGRIELSPQTGYYENNGITRIRITDPNFGTLNIKKGVKMFGLTGSLGEKYATGQAYSTTGGQEFVNINNLGFRPRVVIAKLTNQGAKDGYAAVYWYSNAIFGDLDFRIADNGTIYANASQFVSDNLFKLQVDSINSRLYNWIAFGSEDLN